MTLRRLFKSDLFGVLAIEQLVHVVPWSKETFEACFDSGYDGWVFEEEGKVIGFVIVSLRADECHILNLCVTREYQHKGWGRKLMDEALVNARRRGIGIAYLEVRRSNTPAIALYTKMQFQVVGEREDYYPTPSGHEDALIFAKSLVKNH